MSLVTAAVCALAFCAELGQSMLTPQIPGLGRAFGLGPAATGLVVSLSTLAVVVTAIPSGLLAERYGALRVSLAAGALIALAATLQALATDFALLVAARLVFGVGLAAIWTAGMALLSGAPSAAGAMMAAGGGAHLAGPPLSGVLSDAVGPSLPFWLLAAGAAAVTLLASRVTPPAVTAPAALPGVRAAVGVAVRDPQLRGALTLIALLGVLTGVLPAVIPLLLDDAGFSSGQIGVVFAGCSLIWVMTSGLHTRLPVGVGLLLLAAAAMVPVLSLAAPALIAFVALRAALHAPLAAISYRLAGEGARSAGVAAATAIGLLNVVWAAGATAAPLVAGAALSGPDARLVFVLVALACGAAALATAGRAAVPGPPRLSKPPGRP